MIKSYMFGAMCRQAVYQHWEKVCYNTECPNVVYGQLELKAIVSHQGVRMAGSNRNRSESFQNSSPTGNSKMQEKKKHKGLLLLIIGGILVTHKFTCMFIYLS